jgi:murein DD-endopeptidase MepM/ murein hydrolase activator NlpD
MIQKFFQFLIAALLFHTLLFAKDNSVTVKAKKVGQNVIVTAVNKNPFDVTIAYRASYVNLKADKKLPLLFVLSKHTKKEILKLKILKNSFQYRAHYDWTIGSKDAKHDNSYIYRLPYKRGTKQMVSQGFNGKFSHYGQSQYAVDFNMKEGTGVYVAREGVVVQTKADSNKGGPNRRFAKDANFITIEHNDKTLATYAHLQKNSVLVKVGEHVKRGQLIGYSGKTGFARGPHLHFIVYKAKDGKGRISIPVKFMSAKGIITHPIKGESYRAVQ